MRVHACIIKSSCKNFLLTLGICGWLKSLSTTTPLTSIVSDSLPPTLPSTLMSSKSTSLLSRSATDMMALTAISAICLWQRLMLRKKQVVHKLKSNMAFLLIFLQHSLPFLFGNNWFWKKQVANKLKLSIDLKTQHQRLPNFVAPNMILQHVSWAVGQLTFWLHDVSNDDSDRSLINTFNG